MKGRAEKEALRGRSMRCSPAVHLPNLKRRSTNDFPTRLLRTDGAREGRRRRESRKIRLQAPRCIKMGERRAENELLMVQHMQLKHKQWQGKWLLICVVECRQNQGFNAGMQECMIGGKMTRELENWIHREGFNTWIYSGNGEQKISFQWLSGCC